MRIKSIIFQGLENNDNDLTVKSIICTESPGRDNIVLRIDGSRVRGRPIVTLCAGKTPLKDEPVARALLVESTIYKGEKVIMAKTRFFNNPLSKRLYQKTNTGYMPYWSVLYDTLNYQQKRDYLEVFEWDLLGYSLVGVSSDADCQTI